MTEPSQYWSILEVLVQSSAFDPDDFRPSKNGIRRAYQWGKQELLSEVARIHYIEDKEQHGTEYEYFGRKLRSLGLTYTVTAEWKFQTSKDAELALNMAKHHADHVSNFRDPDRILYWLTKPNLVDVK